MVNKKILVIGDTIIDENIDCKVLGTSNETPTIVVEELKNERTLGGACFFVRNLLNLGADVSFITNRINYGELIKNLDLNLLTFDKWCTIKKRYWVDNYKLLQVDSLENTYLNDFETNKIITYVQNTIKYFDIIAISDYRHGLINKKLAQNIVNICKVNKKWLYVDSQVAKSESNHDWYKGADVFCLNEKEATIISKTKTVNYNILRKKLNSTKIVVKFGEKGSSYYNDGFFVGEPTLNMENTIIDVCGAGDVFFSVLCYFGIDDPLILKKANHLASLSCKYKGTQLPNLTNIKLGNY